MKKLNNFIKTAIFIFSIFILFSSCNKTKTEEKKALKLEAKKEKESQKLLEQTIQQWHITNKRICVLFGYDFNDPAVVEQYKTMLSQRYGLDEDGGLIYPLIYPDSFKRGGKSYFSELYSELCETEIDFAGIVILGAPDTTHIALEKLQDFWESKVPYPVIALFPQDDIAGLEASCDVIIEKSQKVEISGSIVPEEVASQLIKEAPDVLLNTIDYILTLNGALQKNLDLFVHVKQMLKGKTVEMYVDPETGIKSINHFLLK